MKPRLTMLAVYREEKFSNRAINADKEIMDTLVNYINKNEESNTHITKVRGEDFDLELLQKKFDLIFSMAQDENVLNYIEELEKNGAAVVNSSKAIRNCYRSKLSHLLQSEIFEYPKYIHVTTDDREFNIFESPAGYWVKRGDFHSLVDEDVQYINTISDLGGILEQFKHRGVQDVIVQQNCQGELFKFYGVKNRFFNLRYMGKTGKSRYQLDPGNPDFVFDKFRLEKLANNAAEILDLDFFGGDCIITSEGNMHFIDFNDWPSFRTCKNEVVAEMTAYAFDKLNREIPYENCINQ